MESREQETEVEAARRALRTFEPKLKGTHAARVRADLFDALTGTLIGSKHSGQIEGVLCFRREADGPPVEFVEL